MAISPEHLQKGMSWNKPKTPLMLQFEKETSKNSITRANTITGQFEFWIFKNKGKISKLIEEGIKIELKKQKEIQINQKETQINQKELLNNQMLEFSLDFLKEHTYFSKNLLKETYRNKIGFNHEESIHNLGFARLINHFKRNNIITRYSKTNYKINKLELEEFANGKKN